MYTIPVLNVKRGKSIFNNLVEYPLPEKTGVQDYVFYIFAKPNDEYKLDAKAFIEINYPNHQAKDVNSLEALIEYLYLEVQSKPIVQIREIVIVCHGNPLDLYVPITKNALTSTETNKRKYRITSARTLVNLQLAFLDIETELGEFRDKRRVVIEKLLETSWVTVRACRWGKSHEGLYSLFSFFGGRANVYAPTLYQFFSQKKTPIGPGSRFRNREEVFQHLLKQGFAKRTWRSSEKTKEVYINQILAPGRRKEEFVLSSYSLRNGQVVEGSKVNFDFIVSAFNVREVDRFLIGSAFSAEGLPLSNDLIANRKKINEKWVVYDEAFEIAGNIFKMRYEIESMYTLYEDENNYDKQLIVFPFLDHPNGRQNFSFQSFFGEYEKDQLTGKLNIDLAFYITDENIVDEEGRTIYNSYVSLLNTPNLPQGNPIYLKFEENKIPLVSPVKHVITEGKKWKIQDGTNTYTIQEDSSYTLPKGFKKSLSVIKLMTEEKQKESMEAVYGVNPNTPGTELMAYLDNYSREELLDVMHFLRNPYKAEYAFYIHEVQQAIARKFDDKEWFAFMVLQDNDLKNNSLHFPVWNSLNTIEKEDYLKHAYEDNEDLWKEAKASSVKEEFDIDLFEEKRLPYEAEEVIDLPSENSPYLNPNLPRRKPLPPPHFFGKESVYVREPLDNLNCQQFKIAVDILKVNMGKSREEIEKIFKQTTITTDHSLYDYMSSDSYMNSFELAYNLLDIFTPSTTSSNIFFRGLAKLMDSKVGFGLGLFFMYKSIESFVTIDYGEPMLDGAKKSKRNGAITGLKYGAEMINQIIKAHKINGTPIKESYKLINGALDARDAHLFFFNKPDKYFDIMFQNWREAYEEGYKLGIDIISTRLNEILNSYWKIFREYAAKRGLTDCQLKILLQSGLLTNDKVKITVMTAFVQLLYTVDYKANDFKFPAE